MPPANGPVLSLSIQSVLNQSALKRLGNDTVSGIWRTSMPIFMSRRPDGSLIRTQPITELSQHATISAACAQEVAKLSQLQVLLEDRQRGTAEGSPRRRTRAQKRHNAL